MLNAGVYLHTALFVHGLAALNYWTEELCPILLRGPTREAGGKAACLLCHVGCGLVLLKFVAHEEEWQRMMQQGGIYSPFSAALQQAYCVHDDNTVS